MQLPKVGDYYRLTTTSEMYDSNMIIKVLRIDNKYTMLYEFIYGYNKNFNFSGKLVQIGETSLLYSYLDYLEGGLISAYHHNTLVFLSDNEELVKALYG